MSKTDAILRGLLRELAAQQKFTDLRKTAQWLIHEHSWEEVTGVRQGVLTQLRDLLQDGEFTLGELYEVVKGQTLVGGHRIARSQVAGFLKQDEAHTLIQDLIGGGDRPPDAETINHFIERAVKLAFHTNDGSRTAPNAAKFASILLSAVYPDQFVDFVHRHWEWAAEHLEFGEVPSWDYGECLVWAGQVAQRVARTPTFRQYFSTDIPDNWIVAGLVYLFANDGKMQALADKVRSGQMIDRDEVMSMSVEEIWDVLQHHNPQVILQGPPGSGKTYLAERVVQFVAGTRDVTPYRLAKLRDSEMLVNVPVIWEVVQFHPSYCYEDFVRGLVTEPTEGGVVFQVKDRILAQAAAMAARYPQTPVILILDEINRADLARVLGELIYALERDRRGEPVAAQYGVGDPPDRTLRLPKNLYLIGTMNTADRSIALVDYAIRRRFSFFSVLPRVEVIEDFYATPVLHEGDDAIAARLAPPLAALYRAASALFDEVRDADDIRVGHSYFLVRGQRNGEPLSLIEWADAVAFRFAYEVVPMLAEYRKERRLRDDQEHIEVDGQRFSLRLDQQRETRRAVAQWLARDKSV